MAAARIAHPHRLSSRTCSSSSATRRSSRFGGVGDDAGAARAEVWAKMEQANPGGSVKDRIALAMIDEAERERAPRPGGVVVEPTSGNTGIGLALVVRGEAATAASSTMPESMSLERRQLLEAFGAEVRAHARGAADGGRDRPGARDRRGDAGRVHAAAVRQPREPARPRARRRRARSSRRCAGSRSTRSSPASGRAGRSAAWARCCGARSSPRAAHRRPWSRSRARRSRAASAGRRRFRGSRAGFVPKNYHPQVVDEVRTVTRRRRVADEGGARAARGAPRRRSARARRSTSRSRSRASSGRARTS